MFDEEPRAHARRTDPSTSHRAAERKTASKTLGVDLRKVLVVYWPNYRHTAKEAGAILARQTGNDGWTRGKCWKRISDAKQKGLLISVVVDGENLIRDGSQVLRLSHAGRAEVT